MTTCALGHPLAPDAVRCPTCGFGRLPATSSAETAPTPEVTPIAPTPAESTPTQPMLSPDGCWAWTGSEWVQAPPSFVPPPPPVGPGTTPVVAGARRGVRRRPRAGVLAGALLVVALLAGGGVLIARQGGGSQAVKAASNGSASPVDTSTAASGPQVDANGQPVPDGFPTYPDGEVPPASCVSDNPGQHWLCDSVSKGFTGPQYAALVRQACGSMAFTDFPLNITQEPDGQGGGFTQQVTLMPGGGPSDFYEQLTVVGGTTSYRNAVSLGQFAFLTRSPANSERYLTVGCGVTNGGGEGTRTYSRADVDKVSDAVAQPAPSYAPYTPPAVGAQDVASCQSEMHGLYRQYLAGKIDVSTLDPSSPYLQNGPVNPESAGIDLGNAVRRFGRDAKRALAYLDEHCRSGISD